MLLIWVARQSLFPLRVGIPRSSSKARDAIRPSHALCVHLEDQADGRGFLLVDDERGRRKRRLSYVVVSIDAMALAYDLPLPQAMELPAHHALDDLRPFKFGKSAQHGQCQLVLGIADVVLGVDDDLLVMLQEF